MTDISVRVRDDLRVVYRCFFSWMRIFLGKTPGIIVDNQGNNQVKRAGFFQVWLKSG
jgi:hypothetical protein